MYNVILINKIIEMCNVKSNFIYFVYMLYRNNIINLNNYEIKKIELDNMMASNDRIKIDGIINGVEINTENLNINSLVQYIVLVQKYKNEEDKKNYQKYYEGAFEDGYYCGYIDLSGYFSERKNVVRPGTGETVIGLRINLRDENRENWLKLFSTDIDQTTDNTSGILYLKFMGYNIELNYPIDFELRFYDIKRNLISKEEATLNNDNSIEDVVINNYTYFATKEKMTNKRFMETRNFRVLLKYLELSYMYIDGGEDISFDIVIDKFEVAEETFVLRVEEGKAKLLVTTRQFEENQYNNTDGNINIVLIDQTHTQNVVAGTSYSIKEYNINDIRPLFLHYNTIKLDIGCIDNEGFMWLLQEDLEPSSNTTSSYIYHFTYLGNNIKILN